MSFLAFSVHSVPDVKTAARFYNLGDLDESSALKAIAHINQQSGKKNIPLYWQKIAAISCVYSGDSMMLDVKGFGASEENEVLLLQNFVQSVTGRTKADVFVSWNFKSREYPLLTYRCLKNELPAPAIMNANSVSLYQTLAGAENLPPCPQKHITSLLGLEEYPEMSRKEIWKAWLNGDKQPIQDDCTLRAVETYLLYIRYLMVVGAVSKKWYEQEVARIGKIAQNLPEVLRH